MLFFHIFRNTSKNEKPAKKNTPRLNDEKQVKQTPKAKPSYDLPAVQCKDTLLLDYDYSKQYSKRTLVNNWSKYDDIPDHDDDDNAQLTAADYELLLAASKSIGDHFTFAAERSWLHSDAQTEEGSLAGELFKLNISNLENGLNRLPFYVRQDLKEDIFTNEELRDIDYRASGAGKAKQKPLKENKANQNVLSTGENVKSLETSANIKSRDDVKLPSVAEIAPKLSGLTLNTKSMSLPSSSGAIQSKSNSPPTAPSNKTEDIQDWLDDILNEN